jgi:hypothetical protein
MEQRLRTMSDVLPAAERDAFLTDAAKHMNAQLREAGRRYQVLKRQRRPRRRPPPV